MQGPDEDVILESILKYKEFNRFYIENRSKVPHRISWCMDMDSEDDHLAYSDLDVHEIHIKNLPKSKMDAFIIAHELLHFIRENETLSLIHYDIRHLILAESLLSLLEDPIVDYILKNTYNFNPRRLYMMGIENGERKVGGDFLDNIERLTDGFTHASWILKWRLIDDKRALKSWKKYCRRLENGRPIAYKIGVDTSAIVDDIGLDTIEQKKKIVFRLIDRYKMQEILSVGDSQ